MNKGLVAGLIIVAALIGFGVSTWLNKSQMESTMVMDGQQETAVEHASKHADPNYVCPMHPQIVRGEPGNCPICGMDLVAVEAEPESAERKILYYKHPHNPTITSDVPKKDEMGMDYVAVYDDGGGVSVKISPAVINNMGVRTSPAERGRLWRKIDTVGYINYDETKIMHVHLRTDGWIEKLNTKSEGERIRKGTKLFEFYSPSIVNAMEEYVQALDTLNKGLIRASTERLRSLGVSQPQLEKLAKSRKVPETISVYATQDGVVSELKVREGMYVKPGTVVMNLVDLSSVWLVAEVFERQAEWVKVDQFADVTLDFMPGRTWEGKVEYVYPTLDPKTRTLRVRVRFDNPDELLKPNMFAKVSIYGGAKTNIIVIPREALIRTGQEQRVIIDEGDGRFTPRKVVAGMESGDYIEVTGGLREGDNVVVSGHFLIDSEASLKASLLRMKDEGAEKSADMIMGTGVIKKIMADERRLNMTHDPIDSIGWPAMTMDFNFKQGVDVSALSSEDAVEFQLEETKDGYLISSIKKIEK